MTDKQDYGSILDEEEVEVEVRKPVGGVVSVRFTGEEMPALLRAAEETGGTVTGFIREAVLARVAGRQTAVHWHHTLIAPSGRSHILLYTGQAGHVIGWNPLRDADGANLTGNPTAAVVGGRPPF